MPRIDPYKLLAVALLGLLIALYCISTPPRSGPADSLGRNGGDVHVT